MSDTPRTDTIRTFQCSPHMPGGWVPAHKYEETESELITTIEQRDRLAEAIKRYIAEDYTLVALQRTLTAVEGGQP